MSGNNRNNNNGRIEIKLNGFNKIMEEELQKEKVRLEKKLWNTEKEGKSG